MAPVIILSVASLIIVLVTALDCCYSVETGLSPSDELNPLTRWVLERVGLAGMVGLKVLGAGTAVSVLWLLLLADAAVAVWVAVGVGVLMAWLGWFLWRNS